MSLTPAPPPARPPTIVAHRANSTGPGRGENSLTAIAAAARAGADAVEIDVRRTADGHFVLAHDPFQWQQSWGVPLPLPVRWSRRRWVPSLVGLDAALDVALAAGLDVKLDVKDASIAPAVRRHCRERRIDPARVALWCRSPAEVADPSNLQVFGEVGLLADGQGAGDYLADAARSRATAVSLNPDLLSADSVLAAHQQGFTVYAWIVEPGRPGEAFDLGVDGVVTDWVAETRHALR
jgi:glycerophosphoryl diester phosphodiesterase